MPIATLATIIARMSHAEIRVRVELILKMIIPILATLEPWSPFIATVAQLQEVFDRFKEADDGAQTGNFLKQAERNAIRPELNRIATEIGDYIELGARKDPSLLARTAFDIRPAAKSSTASRAPLVAPENFKLQHGPDRGSIIATFSKVQSARWYEFYYTTGDPTLEESWKYYGANGKCKTILTGFEPGKNIWVRSRAVANDSTPGPWTGPVPIMPV